MIDIMLVDGSSRKDRAIVHLPGILQRSEEQIRPLADLLSDYGDVFHIDYSQPYFDGTMVALEVAGLLGRLKNVYPEVVVIGSSIGGALTLPVLGFLQRWQLPIDRLRWLIVDAPSGVETMAAVPPWAAGIFRQALLYFSPTEHANAPKAYGTWLLNAMKGLPKDENVIIPGAAIRRQIVGRDVPEAEYLHWVRQRADEGLTGHRFTQWLTQLRWMASSIVPEGTLGGHDITYVACMWQNDVVRQPRAMWDWAQYAPDLVIDEVQSPHCGYLNTPEVWWEYLRGYLSR